MSSRNMTSRPKSRDGINQRFTDRRLRAVVSGSDKVPLMGDEENQDGTQTDASDDSDRDSQRDSDRDYDRDLGVIEAITFVTRSCPSGVVVSVAEQALEAIKEGGADVLKQQAYFVLTAMKGWRGDRASQVHRSLSRFLENPNDN